MGGGLTNGEVGGGEGGLSVGLVGGEQGSIHGLHAGGAGEGPHEPVVYTVHVVDVHTGQEPDGVAVYKVQHADHTLSDLLLRAVRAPIKDPFGQVLDEADALSYADLLLLSELRGQAGLTGCGVVQRHVSRLLIWRWWLQVWVDSVSKAGPVRLGLMKQRNVVRGRRFETVSHGLPLSCGFTESCFLSKV